jgi:hypothetical protein
MPVTDMAGGSNRRGGRMIRWIRRAASHPSSPLIPALLAVLLTLPSLRVGLVADDYYHRAAFIPSRVLGGLVPQPLDMFRFFDGDPARVQRGLDVGFLPWWTYPKVRAAFWRPLTVLTHWLDYQLWPNWPVLMHLQSVLWYGVLAAAVGFLYRRLLPTAWVALLAAVLYAVDDAHGMPVGFLANRNALLSTLCGVLALCAHDAWRRGQSRRAGCVAPLLLALALLAKEEGLATCAYLAAYAAFLDRGTWRQRMLTLLPCLAVVVIWRATWNYLGYGTADIGLYVDPLREPWSYARAVIERVPYLLLGQWALPPAEIYLLGSLVGTGVLTGVWWAGWAVAILLGVLLTPLLRRDPVARFWAGGMILALLPVCATFPADRLLFFVGLGAMGLLAQWFGTVWEQDRESPGHARRHWIIGVTAVALVFLHLVVAPVALPFRAAYPAGPPFTDQFYLRAPLDASVEQQTAVLVNPPSMFHAVYAPGEREARGEPIPNRIRTLSSGWQAVRLYRPDAQSLLVSPANGYIAETFEHLFRDQRHPFSPGQQIALAGIVVEVTRVVDGWRPAEALFRFAVPLEDESLRWLAWHDGEFRPFTPPAIGETVEVVPGSLR